MTAETIAKALGGRKVGGGPARRMTTAIRACLFGTPAPARCWCAVTPDAISRA
jgi:hypothetical protein